MQYELATLGSVFSTRDRGIELLADLAKKRAHRDDDPYVVIDFEGVHSVTSSFVDEFLGKLMQRAHDEGTVAPELINLAPNVERRVRRTLRYRGLDSPAPLLMA